MGVTATRVVDGAVGRPPGGWRAVHHVRAAWRVADGLRFRGSELRLGLGLRVGGWGLGVEGAGLGVDGFEFWV